MPTLRNMVESARHTLSGFDSLKDNRTALREDISDSVLAIPVADVTGVGTGVAEIDLELLVIQQPDVANTALIIAPYGRGYGPSEAAAHTAGTEVTLNPSWPRGTLAREMNGLIESLYPTLFAVAETTIAVNGEGRYTLPDETVGILSVWYDLQATDDGQAQVDNWSFDRHGGTGPVLRVATGALGTNLRVVYMKRPVPFDLDDGLDQDFHTVTGLEDRIADLMVLGLAARLAPYIDVSRLPGLSTEARADGQTRPYNAGMAATRTLYSMYQQRLDEERMLLNKEHRIKIHLGVN